MLPELLVVVLAVLEVGEFALPGLLEVVLVGVFLLLLAAPPFDLVLEGLLVLVLEQFLIGLLLAFDLCLLLLEGVDLGVEALYLVALELTHFEGLLPVELLALLDLLADQVLLSHLGQVLHLL